jgi:hypothetical protein
MKLKRMRKKKNGRPQSTAGDWGFRKLFEETDKILAFLEKRKNRVR